MIKIDDMHFGFMGRRSTTDAVFVRQLKELLAKKDKHLRHKFVDLEKAFDSVHRELIP